MKTYYLLILLNICHLIGDFTPLSTKEMLMAKRKGYPLEPIYLHAFVHAILMFFVVLLLVNVHYAIAVFVFQLVAHFLIDFTKGRINTTNPERWLESSRYSYWFLFGIDQFLHQLVIIVIVYWVSD